MAEIFISYSTKNVEDARTIKGILLQNGFTVFMAPDSIPGGSNYTKEIPAAIKQCSVFLLLLSNHSQNSIWVSAEVENAFKHEKLIVPFVIENCPINDDFDFLLSRSQRIEAYEKKTEALRNLVERLKTVLNKTTPPPEPKTVKITDNTQNSIDDLFKPAPVTKAESTPPVQSTGSDVIKIGSNVYEGETLNGVPHGKGKMTYSYGAVYEGDFVNGKYHGKGKHISSNGIVYVGDFVEGRKEGKCKCTYPFGMVYEGEVVDGISHGKGKSIYSNGTVYEGDYVKGMMNGKGKFTYTNGMTYEGDYVNGKQHGKGIRVYPDGRRTEVEMSESKLISEKDI